MDSNTSSFSTPRAFHSSSRKVRQTAAATPPGSRGSGEHLRRTTSSPPRVVTVRREEVRALRTAWSQLKDELYQANLVAPSRTLRDTLRALETKLITAPGSDDVGTDINRIKFCIRNSKSISEEARERMSVTVQSLDRALGAVSELPNMGGASLREDLQALQQMLPSGLPLSPTQDPAITAYRRDPESGDRDHPVAIATDLSFLISLTAKAEGLNTADIAEQLRDIALQLHCESPSVPTLQYLTRKLYLCIRSKVDLTEMKYICISFQLSQLMGAVLHLPAKIPRPFQIDLATSTLALAGRPRSTSTPVRPTASMPAPMRAWMALRKTLLTNTPIDKKTVGKFMQLFSGAANKPLSERKAALDQAKNALQLALNDSEPIDHKQANELQTALTHYYQVHLASQPPTPSSAQDQQQHQQRNSSANAHDLTAREPTVTRRNLTDELAAVAGGWNPFADD